jgi:SNW domain-containing protein 1
MDGGAYPEIHVAQYPLNMGKSSSSKHSGTLALQTDSTGKINYDLVVTQNTSAVQKYQTSFDDLKPLDHIEQVYERPSDEEVLKTADRTRAALEKIVDCTFLFSLNLKQFV